MGEAIGEVATPVFYFEIPPSLFGTVIKGLAEAGLTKSARVVVEKPFGHDLASERALNDEIHAYLDESQLYRIDHFLGKMGMEILYLRFANTILEPVWSRNYVSLVQITSPEDFGVADRGHFYDPVGALRDVVVNHLMQMVSAAAPPSGRDPEIPKNAMAAVFRAMADADPWAVRELSGRRRRGEEFDDRDVRRAEAGGGELAMVKRSVLHQGRQGSARQADGAAPGLPPSAQARVLPKGEPTAGRPDRGQARPRDGVQAHARRAARG